MTDKENAPFSWKNPENVARHFARLEASACCVCDRSSGAVFLIYDRPHHVSCYQRLALAGVFGAKVDRSDTQD